MTHPYDPREELDDRDLDPPAEESEPLDLKVLAERADGLSALDLGRLSDDAITLREFLDFDVPEMLERLRVVEKELARWKAMPVEHRYVVVTDDLPDPEHPLTEEVSEAAALNEARSWKGGRAMSRTVHLGPWQDLTELATAPPF
ncbi:hypothetical protein [Streptosporangium vulgare]|uniref:Uncharacterized protein n=1 Tax=Streptosporangium vulgare TaxID=46190 RepID=A0ABV5TST0_9ACTN